MDQAEALALAWCIYHVPSSRVIGRHLHLCAPQATPVAPYTEARSGISARDVLDVPGIDAAVRALEESLVQHGWSPSSLADSANDSDNNSTTNNTNQQQQQPTTSLRFSRTTPLTCACNCPRNAAASASRCRLLAQPNYLLLTKEVQKWMCHHPDSAHDLASFALRDLCYYFRADLAPGVPIGRLPAAGKCLEFSANFAIPAGLNLVPYGTTSAVTGKDKDDNQQQEHQADDSTHSTNPLLPSPLHRCESMANLVTALRAYQYSDVLSLPIDARAGAAQFQLEQSYVLHLAGLPRDPAPSQADLLAWFQGYGMQPTKLHMLVTRTRQPTGDGFAEFANHDEAKVALAMNGRMFRASSSSSSVSKVGGGKDGRGCRARYGRVHGGHGWHD
ncbi:hypothetical protein BCR44DRAFT_1061322 [Catenaria anguillulae PL171]|uniref:RRM domain-containing protein n=1 Tax=Catenaria anguillulae PL171 TaxID=765915 RepID=A0A1Y2HUQ7_9FUNG|nr:hypothetical protein BCR44DRAFT_1061322 [Catenaria anguillulae PL171]